MRRSTLLIPLRLVAVALGGCSYFEAPAPAADLVVLDTRSLAEYQRSHVQGAIHLPYDNVRGLQQRLPEDKSTQLVVYCTAGILANTARRSLEAMGYINVTNAGGLQQMVNAGWPLAGQQE